MADTIRTLGELNALLADNTTGDISAQDMRDILASMNVHTETRADGTYSNVTPTTLTQLDTSDPVEQFRIYIDGMAGSYYQMQIIEIIMEVEALA